MLNLRENSIEMWLIDEQTAIKQKWIQNFALALSDEEKKRAQACKSAKRQQQFQITRIALRFILSLYFPHLSPKQHILMQTTNGKPYIASNTCQFSVSHSSNKILIALSKTLELGVDIELMNPKRDIGKIAQMYFHPDEWPDELPLQKRLERFYQLWTLKEAFVKAEGKGLLPSANVHYFDTSKKQPRLIAEPRSSAQYRKWKFAHSILNNEYSLAVAWEDKYLNKPIKFVSRRLETSNSYTPVNLI